MSNRIHINKYQSGLNGVRALVNGLAAAAIFFGATACLAQTQDWQKVWAATLAAAKKEGVVVCGCPVHPGSRAYLISQWAKDYPEIKLQYTGALSPEWPTRVEVERSAGQFLWDNMFTGPGAETYRLARISAFDRLVPHLILPDVADPKTWGGWDSAFYDAGKERMLAMWMDISMPHYNARVVAPEKVAAMGLRAILEPEYKGRIVMWDPRVSGGGELQSTHFYMRLGEDAHRKLLVDQQPVFLRDSRAMAERMVRGTAVFSLGPTLDEPLEDFRKAGVTMDIRPMGNAKEVAYGSAGYGIATIMDRPPHPNAARVFVNWLLSKNIQEGLGRAAARQSRRRDVPAIHAPPAGAKPGEDYIELQREVMEAQRQKIMAISRQLRPN